MDHERSRSSSALITLLTDDALQRFGSAARFMGSPEANGGKPPRETFLVQLREATAEWKRRP